MGKITEQGLRANKLACDTLLAPSVLAFAGVFVEPRQKRTRRRNDGRGVGYTAGDAASRPAKLSLGVSRAADVIISIRCFLRADFNSQIMEFRTESQEKNVGIMNTRQKRSDSCES